MAEVALTGYKHLGVNFDYQWNPYTSQTEKSEISVQYRPDSSRVVNIGYRFQEGILKQWDGSFAWPIARALEHGGALGLFARRTVKPSSKWPVLSTKAAVTRSSWCSAAT